MRHVLYDSSLSFVSLDKEIEFLNSYVDLMRLRYTDVLKMDIDFPAEADAHGYYVPSLLFVQFLENAFKHGVSYNRKSKIIVRLGVDDNFISFYCVNSCNNVEDKKNSVHAGIGIDNARKRLSLLYGDDFSLEINKSKDSFSVLLKIPVRNDKVYIN